MNTEIMRNQVHASIDRHCASLTSDPYRVVRVLRDANAESGGKVRRKVSWGLVCVLVLVLMAAVAAAAVLLSMQQVVENYAIPMAQEYEDSSYTAEDTNVLLQLAEENGIVLSPEGKERINHMLQQGEGYYKDELIRELAKAEFGNQPLQWTLGQQKWYNDVCMVLGLSDSIEALLPDQADFAAEEAVTWARQHIIAEQGTTADSLSESFYVIGVQYTQGCEEIAYLDKCWTVWFTPRTLESAEYVVYMDEHGTLLKLIARPGLSETSTVEEIHDMYVTVYGGKNTWTQNVLNAFREAVLQSPDTHHQAYLCMLHTTYPKAIPENAISKDAAIAIAASSIQAESYIAPVAYLIDTAEHPVWKFGMNFSGDQWSFEVDCITGEIKTARQRGFGDSKWWMSLVLWEVSDEVRSNWVDDSPSVG